MMQVILTLGVILALFAHGVGAAGRVFYDGFEDGTTNAWQADPSPHPKCSVVTTAADGMYGPQAGTRMAKCNWDGQLEWFDPNTYSALYLPSFPYTREFLIRFWVRSDANVDHILGGKWLRLSGTNNSFIFAGQMEQAGGPMYANWEQVGGEQNCCVLWDGGLLGDEQWHKVEIYILHDTNGTDGCFKIWNNDVLVQNVCNRNTTDTGLWSQVYVMSNWSQNRGLYDSINNMYWDEFEIFSDTGTGGSGSMFDGTMTQGGTPLPPTVSSLSCSPTSIQSVGTSTCTAVTGGGTPDAYSWTTTLSGTQCQPSSTTTTISSVIYTCQYGGTYQPCVTASNSGGSSAQVCANTALSVRYRKPSGFGAN